MQGEVRLFPRVLIRKLPGSHFCLSFFLLLGHMCRAGTSERTDVASNGGDGGGGGYYSAVHIGGGDGDKKGSAPRLMGQGLAAGTEQDPITGS